MKQLVTGLILCSPWLMLIPVGVSHSTPAEVQPKTPQCSVPAADGYDWPVGPPDAAGYYDAQPFGKNRHLGEDWNGNGGGNSDYGEPVSSIGRGVVSGVGEGGPGWGTVVIIRHCRPDEHGAPEEIESLYAHLSEVAVREGDVVERGQRVGRIGDAEGAYIAHLHFEVRDPNMPIGGGYSTDTRGYHAPSRFIAARRPAGEAVAP